MRKRGAKAIRSEGDCLSAEAIAALIDGRTSERERRLSIPHLDSCVDCRTVLAYSAQFAEDPHGVVREAVPASPRWQWLAAPTLRGRVAVGAMAAALLLSLTATLVSNLFPRLRGTPSLSRLATDTLVEPLYDEETPISSAELTWRGEANTFSFAAGLTQGQHSFRTGVQLIDLRVCLEERRWDEAERMLHEMGERWSSVGAELRAEAEAGRPGPVWEATEKELGADLDLLEFAFGRWTEAARLAAATRNGRYFRGDLFRNNLTDFSRQDLPETVAGELKSIRELLASRSELSDAELGRLERRFRQLIAFY